MTSTKKPTESIRFITENSRTVLERRYLKKDSSGKVSESPEQMFRRVAAHIAQAEKNIPNKQISKT